MRLSLSLLALCAVYAYAQDDHVQLHLRHRLVHPNLPITSWTDFGTISVPSLPFISSFSTPVAFVPSESLSKDLSDFVEHVDLTLDESFHQITVQRPGMSDAMWPVSIMKAVSATPIYVVETEDEQCLMPMSTSSSITVHLSPLGEPLGIDYFLSSVPHNGVCPPPPEMGRSYSVHNTTVSVKSPRSPPLYVIFSVVPFSADQYAFQTQLTCTTTVDTRWRTDSTST